MLVDGFTFFNELDVLAIRLEELYPVVDQFVIVEADMTFRGDPKPSFFSQYMEFFTKYFDKITLRQVTNPGNVIGRDGEIPWIREKAQRNGIGNAFKDLAPDDIVMVSDVDEIPRRATIESANIKELTSLNMHMYYYGLNIYDCEWGAAKMLPYKDFTTAEEVRHAQANRFYDNAGWHFSYLGTPEQAALKLKSFSHWELDTPEITNVANLTERMKRNEDLWGHGKKYQKVEVDNTYPEAVKRRPEYFKKYIW
jgi:beta-1,4-mannosyl-glycoprotein beta-1,4-N-acetylglucosaminyltransferase